MGYRGTSLMRNRRRPQDHHRAIDMGLLWGPRRKRFFMREVPLYMYSRKPLKSLPPCPPLCECVGLHACVSAPQESRTLPSSLRIRLTLQGYRGTPRNKKSHLWKTHRTRNRTFEKRTEFDPCVFSIQQNRTDRNL